MPIYNRKYHIQDIKDLQHKNINVSWDYPNFPRHPVAAKKFEMRGINTIILHYNYWVDSKVVKGVCATFHIPCACPYCISNIDKDWLLYCAPSSQLRYAHVGNGYYSKIFEHFNDWIIMEFICKNKTQVYLYNINALILSGMSTNNA